jgi:hypothetical protein
MENIEAFYALAFKYGFINYDTYIQIILKLSIINNTKKEKVFSDSEPFTVFSAVNGIGNRKYETELVPQ